MNLCSPIGLRAAVSFYNGLLPSNSATLKQTLHADLKLVPRAKTSWASDILRALEGLRGCDTYTQAFLQGLPICCSDFIADLRFRMRKVLVWWDIADMNPLESDNKLATYHSWFACLLLDLQADSRSRVRNGGAPLMPPRYLHLDLPKHVMRNVSRIRLRAHTLEVESSIWCGGNGHCDTCFCAAVQNEVHMSFFTVQTCLCALSVESNLSFSSLSANPFLWRPLIFHMPCLVRLSLIFFLNGTIDSAISFRTLWTIFWLARPATNHSA